MSTMFSKKVQDKLKEAEAVVEGSRTYAEEYGARRSDQLKKLGVKGAPSKDELSASFRFRGVVVEVRMATLRTTTAKVAEEVGDDAAVFTARDEAVDTVYDGLSEFRTVATPLCGEDEMARIGFSGDTPRDPAPLLTLGEHVLAQVKSDPPRTKKAKKGVKFDALAALEGLDTSLQTLASANQAVLREARELVLARAQRNEAFAAFARELSAATAGLDADLRAVGMDDVADRLVPSRRGGGGGGTTESEPEPQPT